MQRKNYNGVSATSAYQAKLARELGPKKGTFEKARLEASAFLIGIAPPHYATADAPSTWDDLKGWLDRESNPCPDYTDSRFSLWEVIGLGAKIPVFDGGGATVYTSRKANLAYRAWHDYTHLTHNLSFSLPDEKRVAQLHLKEAKNRGLSHGARWLLWIDSQGQNQYYSKYGDFVDNQYLFVRACFDRGINAVLDSGERF